ncbi:hypothetical protein EHP00_1261 [Ecytonucleospora hepatopenaei]|uniref:Uncharacterized protein n=1 Tax=Ecytonucleospora hepatopenaei TaxID=646526 RepID=A0A1W0E6C6_9MICR|nr:hypothetical protein EHP00_1261 [Ecytonucleospora hepatopenaei]
MILCKINLILCAYSLSGYNKETEYATIQTFKSYANLTTISELTSSFPNEFILNQLLESVKGKCEENNISLIKSYYVGNRKLKVNLGKSVDEILLDAFKFVIGKFTKKVWFMYDFCTTKHDLRTFLEKNYKNKKLNKKDREDFVFLRKQYENMGIFLKKQTISNVFDLLEDYDAIYDNYKQFKINFRQLQYFCKHFQGDFNQLDSKI